MTELLLTHIITPGYRTLSREARSVLAREAWEDVRAAQLRRARERFDR